MELAAYILSGSAKIDYYDWAIGAIKNQSLMEESMSFFVMLDIIS